MPVNTSGIRLADRVKELTYDGGTSNVRLTGAAQGFSTFASFYASGDIVFYAITDGTEYEVGSGIYHYKSSADDELSRSSIVSTNGNNAVNFSASTVKEVFVTYPANFSVYTASGLAGGFSQPSESGLAFWQTGNILNYDPNIVWDQDNDRLGVSNIAPEFAIDVGGPATNAQVRASGMIVGGSGVLFPSGRQIEHFLRNTLIDGTGDQPETTNITELIQLSGVVDQYIGLVKQEAGQVLAGPPSGCAVGCSPNYPSFRQLTYEDLPDLSPGGFVSQLGGASKSGVAFFDESGVIAYDSSFIWNSGFNRLGIGFSDPDHTLAVNGDVLISGMLFTSGIYGLTAGSGLEAGGLHNFTFNVKDVFSLGVSGHPTAVTSTISQADIVMVSGISGVQTILTTSGDTHTVLIDGGELQAAATYTAGSGLILDGQEFNVDMASGVFRYDDNLCSGADIWNHVSGVSGYLATQTPLTAQSGIRITNQVIELADPDSTLVYLPSGSMVKASDAMLFWDDSIGQWSWSTIAQLDGRLGTATGGDPNENSWQNIIVTSGTDNFSHPWGVDNLSATFDADSLYLVGGSGVIIQTTQDSGIRFSAPFAAGSGLRLQDTGVSGTKFFHVPSGGIHESGIVKLTNSAGGPTDSFNDSLAVTPAFLYSVSGHLSSSTYWDGNLFEDSGIYLPTGNFASMGGGTGGGYSVANGQQFSVVMAPYPSGGKIGQNNDRSVFLGINAGRNANSSYDMISIGNGAGGDAASSDSAIFIGKHAGSGVSNSTGSVFIGEEAGQTSQGDYSINIGYSAGSQTNSDYSSFIGPYAGTNLTGDESIEILSFDEVSAGITSSNDKVLNIGNTIAGNLADNKVAIGAVKSADATPDRGPIPIGTLDIYPAAVTNVGVFVSGIKDQTADLTQWHVENVKRLSVSKSGVLVMDSTFDSGRVPINSVFVDEDNNKLSYKNNVGLVINLDAISAGAYVPTTVIELTAASGVTGFSALSSAANNYVRCTYNGPSGYVTVNVPENAVWSPAIGTEIAFEQANGVNVSVLPSGPNVAINSAYSRTSAGQYSVMSIKKVDTNTWTLTGDIQ